MFRSLVARPAVRAFLNKRSFGGHADRPGPPTFVRLPPPNKPLHEESELVWHDGVAPELALDFDAPEVSTMKAVLMWLTGLSCFGLLYAFHYFIWDAEGRRPAKKRELDVFEALGEYQNCRTPQRFLNKN